MSEIAGRMRATRLAIAVFPSRSDFRAGVGEAEREGRHIPASAGVGEVGNVEQQFLLSLIYDLSLAKARENEPVKALENLPASQNYVDTSVLSAGRRFQRLRITFRRRWSVVSFRPRVNRAQEQRSELFERFVIIRSVFLIKCGWGYMGCPVNLAVCRID
ncbi:hypothetical protein BMG00_13030 [Thioclava marina]|uniref:Uncharacterized protein n=1 Tax=Thioclava marina TaxID=1915077 RepID=A0ABX3MP53_9RHOB|nr:hypothetical protein [Thioclava marina]OOY11989.1 hypothetical protein BMG00_13030 [Thioclava marina]